MSFSSGEDRKRPGIFDSFRAAMTPAPLPEDDGLPIAPPRTVTIATALSLVAGLLLIVFGVASFATGDAALDEFLKSWNTSINQCDTSYPFAHGPEVVVQEGATDAQKSTADSCKGYRDLSPEEISNARVTNKIFSVALIVVGLLAAVSGWFLRSAKRWARSAIVGITLVMTVATMLLSLRSLLTLGATLFLVVAVMLSIIGKGGVYFARMRARRASS